MKPHKEHLLSTVVILSLLGLIYFAIIDENSRPAFLEVAKLSLGAYIGYLIPHE
jgi:hypothetical protein